MCLPVIELSKKGKLLSSIQVKKIICSSYSVFCMESRVVACDFYETTTIFPEKDDFSVSKTSDSEKKIPVLQKADLDSMIFA